MRRRAGLVTSLVIFLAAFQFAGEPTVAAQTPTVPCGAITAPTLPPPTPPKNLRIIGGGDLESEWELTAGPSADPEEAIDMAAPLAAFGPHTYYEGLLSRSDCVAAYSLRDPAQIDKYKFGLYQVLVKYDATLEAAKWQWNTNDLNAEQIRLPISLARPATGSAKLLIISDHYWDAGWLTEWWYDLNGTLQRLEGWKWLQVTGNTSAGGTRENIWFEPQMRWIGWDAGVLSWFGIRGYQSTRLPTTGGLTTALDGQRICGKNFLGDSLGPMLNCFKATPFTWTRTWIEIEERAGDDYARLSMWMADEKQDPMPIILNAEMWSFGRHSEFWIEYNSSRPNRVGGPMVAAARNVVVLKNLADPTSVFARPIQ